MFSFPKINPAEMLVIDVETKDPDLEKTGPGVRRGAELLGLAVHLPKQKFSRYFAFGHHTNNNCTMNEVRCWFNEEMRHFRGTTLGANITYDLDFLQFNGFNTQPPYFDIQVIEPLIDETQMSFSLNALSKKYLGKTKVEDELEELKKKMGLKGKVQKHLKEFPGNVVGIYAIGDVELTYEVFKAQEPIVKENNLSEVLSLETDLIPMLLKMRQIGVRVDVDRVERTRKELFGELEELQGDIDKMTGFGVDVWSNDSMGKAMDHHGIKYELTKKDKKPSVTQDFLSRSDHRFLQLVLDFRKKHKIVSTFIDGLILGHLVGDRVHPCFNQLRSDDSGTVSGRFSCSDPNLQQIPARDPILGPLCRSFFIPEDGQKWAKLDYSQIELRILAHYAMGPGSNDIRQAYIEDPNIDFHQKCADLAGIDRRHAKNINFGVVYGMGVNKTAAQLGLEPSEAKAFLKEYNSKMPFLKHTAYECQSAASRGFVRTIMNRRRHFPFWQPRDFNLSREVKHTRDKEKMIAFVKEARVKASDEGEKVPAPGVERSMRYKALNAVIQGTAADLMKKAMVDIWNSGICEELGYPLITVHDELDYSFDDEKLIYRVKEIMEDAIPFDVPVVADVSIGNDWSEAK